MHGYEQAMQETIEGVNIDGTSVDDFAECQTIEEQLDWLFCNLFGVE